MARNSHFLTTRLIPISPYLSPLFVYTYYRTRPQPVAEHVQTSGGVSTPLSVHSDSVINNSPNHMKYAIILVVVLAFGGGIYYLEHGNKQTFERVPGVVTEIVEKTVEISELEKRIADAQHASSTEIEEKAQEAYNEEKSRLLTEIELEVTRTYREEIEDREAKLEESVSSFVTARVN